MNESDVNRALRAGLWPALKAHGFEARTERVAWRYAGDDVDLVELQAVGQHAEALGCPPLSLATFVASYPRFLPRDDGVPRKDGRLRPHYWHCDPFYLALTKGLSQPWFHPFGHVWDRRTGPSFRRHREGLKAVIDPTVHDRDDTWYMREDGSNLDDNVRDITRVVLIDGLAFLEELHNPQRALHLLEGESLLPGDSPHATELRGLITSLMTEQSDPPT